MNWKLACVPIMDVRANLIFSCPKRSLEHALVAHPLNGLANLYHRQGKYEQARVLYERVLDMRQRLLEPQHPDTVETRKWYAALLRAMDRPEEATFLEAPLFEQGKAGEEQETPHREH